MGSRDGGYGSGHDEQPDLRNRVACASCAALRAQLAASQAECERLRGLIIERLPERAPSIALEDINDHLENWYEQARAAIAAGSK
jgi:hypothetical protein